jgi:putative membrane protein
MNRRLQVPAVLAAFALLGCGQVEREQVDTAVDPIAAELTDPGIVHILTTANTLAIEAGQFALERAQGEPARTFAQRMVADHQAANDTVRQRAVRLGISPAETEVSRTLRGQADIELERLGRVQGAEFDRSYLEYEANRHAALHEQMGDLLMPAAASPELRELIREMRDAVEQHLSEAQRLVAGQPPRGS